VAPPIEATIGPLIRMGEATARPRRGAPHRGESGIFGKIGARQDHARRECRQQRSIGLGQPPPRRCAISDAARRKRRSVLKAPSLVPARAFPPTASAATARGRPQKRGKAIGQISFIGWLCEQARPPEPEGNRAAGFLLRPGYWKRMGDEVAASRPLLGAWPKT